MEQATRKLAWREARPSGVSGAIRRLNAIPVALASTALIGCQGTQRSVTIESDPPGALVWLNDREVGRTPVTVPFTFYGTYDVRLEADGREPLWTIAQAAPPWWEHPPLDLGGEALGGDVQLSWHFTLPEARPTDDAAIDALVDHAKQLRARLDAAP